MAFFPRKMSTLIGAEQINGFFRNQLIEEFLDVNCGVLRRLSPEKGCHLLEDADTGTVRQHQAYAHRIHESRFVGPVVDHEP